MVNEDEKVRQVLDEVSDPIEEYFDDVAPRTLEEGDDIPLNIPSYGSEEVLAALEKLLSTWVTMGDGVFTFEDEYADYCGTDSALMVNSGSSANLVLLKTLRNMGKLEEGDEILVPATTWSTSVAPILDVGCVPVFVDVNPHTFNIDVESCQQAVTDDTQAIMAVHLLGNPADMDGLTSLCDDENLLLLEDSCEAHGATHRGRRVGSIGDGGTYSFFFSHHICTMEGGMVVGDDDLVEAAKPVRAHGWMRETDDYEQYAEDNDWFDPKFIFEEPGLNVRPTDIQGVFGSEQLKRLDGYIDTRREAGLMLREAMRDYKSIRTQLPQPHGTHTYYGFGLVVDEYADYDVAELAAHLESEGIETRPIMGGNLSEHPAFDDVRVAGDLDGATDLMENGLFIGIHHGVGVGEVERIAAAFDDFLADNE